MEMEMEWTLFPQIKSLMEHFPDFSDIFPFSIFGDQISKRL